MTHTRTLLTVALVAFVSVAGWMFAKPQAAAVLTAQDAHEIEQLYATMYQGSDFRDKALWLSTFAEDGVFVFPTGDEVAGKQALGAWREKSFAGQTGDSGRRHGFTSIRMTATPDGGATATAYWIELDVKQPPSAIKNTGTAEDTFVKTAEGWKFKRHIVKVDGFGN